MTTHSLDPMLKWTLLLVLFPASGQRAPSAVHNGGFRVKGDEHTSHNVQLACRGSAEDTNSSGRIDMKTLPLTLTAQKPECRQPS